MAIDAQKISASMQELLPLDRFDVRELEVIRLILRGGSVVDWRRLNFSTHDEVDDYLRLCLLRPGDPQDDARAREILAEAVAYLRSAFRYRVADAVAQPESIHDLFLMASGIGEHRRWRRIACIVLKVMHTIFHTDAREMLFRMPISSERMAELVDERARGWFAELQQVGAPVVEMSGSVKSRESMITKLLAKRETVAAQIFDQVRYRVITKERRDIFPILRHLTERLVPFNFVVPAQTENSLVSFRRLLEDLPSLAVHVPRLQLDPYEATELEWTRKSSGNNEFSGKSYRVLNFVADVPIRLDVQPDLVLACRRVTQGPAIAFMPVEFQFIDVATAEQNEAGENSHERYKRRQQLRVLRRLSRGLVVPKRRLAPFNSSGGANGTEGNSAT